jgi:hypothetical protein
LNPFLHGHHNLAFNIRPNKSGANCLSKLDPIVTYSGVVSGFGGLAAVRTKVNVFRDFLGARLACDAIESCAVLFV